MKKIFSVIIISIIMVSQAAAQLGGSGTLADPYFGSISSSVTWDLSGFPGGIVYIGKAGTPAATYNDITVNTGGHLTLGAGITVTFLVTTSDLIITGSGILTANGNSSSQIIFTKGSSISHWGHISFEVPGSSTPITGTGSFKYCKVEYGYANGAFPNPNSAGGGIQINAPNVTLENCYFQNNYATFGGGVTVNANQNTTIKNCYFKSNSAYECAGALLLYLGTSSNVQNCIFESNSCTGTTQTFYGGGAIWVRQSTSKIVNCTFVNNTSPRAGDALYSYNSSTAKIVNSIFWGSNDQFATTGTAAAISNCAFETTKPASAVNSIILNSVNSNPAGPNFIATDGTNWAIKYISPCRDAGTTPTPTVPTDYLGKSRIGSYDIGAYEVQYCVWTGNTDGNWDDASNWSGGFMASGAEDVIIPAGRPNYPYSSSTVIGANKYLIIEPAAQATFGTLDLNGTSTLWLKSSSYGATELTASLMVDYYELPVGNVNIELNLQGNGSMWHYLSPPVASIPATLFSSNGAGVTEYRENLISTDMNNGWVTSTGYHYDTSLPTPAWVYNAGNIWTNLVAGSGYNYYSATNKVFNISGTPNVGDFNIPLAYNTQSTVPDHPAAQGWNLIGNPYTCGLDWDAVVDANSIWDDAEAAIYFRKNNLTYYYVDGSIVPNDYNNPGNFIAPMQGFFVKSKASGVNLLIPASARTHTISKRYKGASSSPHKGSSSSHVRLQLENTTMTDQTVLSFNESATSGFDNRFDARKLFPSSDKLSISSSLGGTEYAINSIPYPANSVSVPLIINAGTSGSYTIRATEIQGLESYNVILNDKLQNEFVNLSNTGSYSFNASAGSSADRFIITVSDILTSIPETNTSLKPFNIYSSEEQINIQTLTDGWTGEKGRIKITDMTGRTISVSSQIEFSKGEIIHMPVNLSNGIYVVEVNCGIKRFVGKVAVR